MRMIQALYPIIIKSWMIKNNRTARQEYRSFFFYLDNLFFGYTLQWHIYCNCNVNSYLLPYH